MTQSAYYSENAPSDELRDDSLPGGLNALTILTIIGCIIFLFFSVFGYLNAKSSYDKKDETIAQMNSDKIPGFMRSMMPEPAAYDELITKSYENRLPVMLVSLVSVALSFVGALQMRKRKKQGYTLYVIGELLTYVSTAIFIGMIGFSGGSFYFMLVFDIIFIALYTLQRKHLLY